MEHRSTFFGKRVKEEREKLGKKRKINKKKNKEKKLK